MLEKYPWLLIVVPAALGGYLMYDKRKKHNAMMKGVLIGGTIGYILYYLYNLPWWVKLLGGLGIVGGAIIFLYLGGGALIIYFLTRKRR